MRGVATRVWSTALVGGVAGLLEMSVASAQQPTIDVVHYLTAGAESDAVRVLADAFEARGGVWVESVVPGGDPDAIALLMSRLAGGNPPSAKFATMGPATIELGNEGVLRDLAELAAANGGDQTPKALTDLATTSDGKVYALPLAIETQNIMWYSIPVFEAAGLELPGSWGKFIEQAPVFTEKGFIPFAVGAQPWQITILFNSVVIGEGGPQYYNTVFSAHDEAAAGDATMVKVFQTLRALSEIADAGSANRPWVDTLNLVAEGKAAFQIQGSWAGAELNKIGKGYGTEWSCALPPGNTAVALYSTGFEFPLVTDPDQVAGQGLFAAVLLDPAVQSTYAAVKGAIPARLDADVSALAACDKMAVEKMRGPDGAVSVTKGVMTAGGFGKLEELVSQFWADKSMTPEAAAQSVAAIIAAE